MKLISKKQKRALKRKTKKFLKSYRKSLKANSSLYVLMALLLAILGVRLTIISLPPRATSAHVSYASKKVESPPKPIGPAQSNRSFSTYPVWVQNYSNLASSKLSSRYWNIYLGPPPNGNDESEYYTGNSTNLRVGDGSLTLEATQQTEPDGYNYGSARIDTQNKVSFLYGRIDITATLPNGIGTWPAAWLLPANTEYENLSPLSDSTRYLNGGEIDLIEEVGFNPNVNYGIVHTLSTAINLNGVGLYNTIYLPNNNSMYYTYSVLWTPTSISFEVNNMAYFTYNKPADSDYTTWPFDQPFYLILNLALGGSWGGEDTSQFPLNGIDNSIFPTSMHIKSIYYYPYEQQAS